MPATADAEAVDAPEAMRLVVRAVAAAVAFVLAGSVAVLVDRSGSADDPRVVDELPGGVPVLGGWGPSTGEDVAAYVARRRAALARVEGGLVAVVSFAAYHPAGEVAALVPGVRVRGLLVAAPGGEPSVATGSLREWAARERRAAAAERTELERLLLTTEDAEFVQQYHADIARLTALLARLDADDPLVFGAVVQAPADALRSLARRGGVRLVDPVGERFPDRLSVPAGLRPEETAKAGTPPTRPFPST